MKNFVWIHLVLLLSALNLSAQFDFIKKAAEEINEKTADVSRFCSIISTESIISRVTILYLKLEIIIIAIFRSCTFPHPIHLFSPTFAHSGSIFQ